MNTLILARRMRLSIGAIALMVAAALLAALAALALTALSAGVSVAKSTNCVGRDVFPGDDLDQVVNSDPSSRDTRFCVHPGTYTIDKILTPDDGDSIIAPIGNIHTRGPASYGTPSVLIRNGANLSRMMSLTGNVTLQGLDVAGGVGRYADPTPDTCANWGSDGRCPLAGTGIAIGAANSGPDTVLRYMQVHHNDAVGIAGMNGKILYSETFQNTLDPNFLGFTAAGVKGVQHEYEIAYSYVHDEPGNGIWCDHGCWDSPELANGFWVHDNLVVNNGRWGVRYEFSPRGVGEGVHLSQPTALVEDNEIHGNGIGGTSMHDAQNGIFRNNELGAKTIADVSYPKNNNVGMHFSDSNRSDRTDLWNADVLNNQMNGEIIKGCEKPDEVVACKGNT